MQLHGLHHVTAVSAQIGLNYQFYTEVMGLRLVKKSVNQDDVSAYHLFYADKVGSPGTDMTFFDWPHIGENYRGTDSIAATAFRVNGRDALDYWRGRLAEYGRESSEIQQFGGRDILYFDDPEGQRLILVDDQNAPYEGTYWAEGGIPEAYALRGFYAALLSTPIFNSLHLVMTQVLGFSEGAKHPHFYPDGGPVTIFSTDGGGAGREIWVAEEPNHPVAHLGAGGVHHIAFRVRDQDEQQAWRERLRQVGLPASGLIDRFYFQSVYFRVSAGILFELATDGPGFGADESLETLGERLALPPFLEPNRAQIEANLKPINPPNSLKR